MDPKAFIRRSMLRNRESMPPDLVGNLSRQIVGHLLDFPIYREASSFGCFVSFKNEVETRPLLQNALKNGKSVAVPRVGSDGLMEHVRIQDLDQLRPGALGILEPPDSEKAVSVQGLDFVAVPGLAFSLSGGRIGFGKGYYDRHLAQYDGPAVALAYGYQIVDGLPMASYDRPIDYVVTEDGIRQCSQPEPEP